MKPSETFFSRIQPNLLNYGNYAVLLLILTIPFSTAITTVASILLVLFWLASAQFKNLPALYREQKAPFIAFLLFVYFIFGVSYSSATLSEAFRMAGKYRELILITILIPFLAKDRFRKRAVTSFEVASIVNLISSYALYFYHDYDFNLLSNPDYSPSFKSSITHSLFISFFAFYCAHRAAQKSSHFMIWVFLFLLSAHNLFFIVPGRTGQLIFFLLIVLFSFQKFSTKGILLSLLSGIIFLALFLGFSDKSNRIVEGFNSTQAYLQGKEGDTSTSMAKRLTFWKYTSRMIAEKPWFGYGTGSYAHQYKKIAPHTNFMPGNPHNEFLMIFVQLGIGGFILFLVFLASLFRHALKLSNDYRWLAQGILLALVVNSLFNSTFLDHAEGHWFACLIAIFFPPFSRNKEPRTGPCSA